MWIKCCPWLFWFAFLLKHISEVLKYFPSFIYPPTQNNKILRFLNPFLKLPTLTLSPDQPHFCLSVCLLYLHMYRRYQQVPFILQSSCSRGYWMRDWEAKLTLIWDRTWARLGFLLHSLGGGSTGQVRLLWEFTEIPAESLLSSAASCCLLFLLRFTMGSSWSLRLICWPQLNFHNCCK